MATYTAKKVNKNDHIRITKSGEIRSRRSGWVIFDENNVVAGPLQYWPTKFAAEMNGITALPKQS